MYTLFFYRNDNPKLLLGSYPTKATPVLNIHFTRRNLLLASGPAAVPESTKTWRLQLLRLGRCQNIWCAMKSLFVSHGSIFRIIRILWQNLQKYIICCKDIWKKVHRIYSIFSNAMKIMLCASWTKSGAWIHKNVMLASKAVMVWRKLIYEVQ